MNLLKILTGSFKLRLTRKMKRWTAGIMIVIGIGTYLGIDMSPLKQILTTNIDKEVVTENVGKTVDAINATQNTVNDLLNNETFKVISVYDGDTVALTDKNNKKIKIRLYGIDAPELKQKGGKFSRDLLYNKIYNKNVKIDVKSTDRYGRKVAKIYCKNEYINLYMLKEGGAWWYRDYAKNDKDLEKAFNEARNARKGIFSDRNIENPADYRKSRK